MNFATGEQRHLRVSDQERDEVINHLKACTREGRIGLDELSERVQSAVKAKTLGELQDLCIDLPDDPTASLVKIDKTQTTICSNTRLQAWEQDKMLRHRHTRYALVVLGLCNAVIILTLSVSITSTNFLALMMVSTILSAVLIKRLGSV